MLPKCYPLVPSEAQGGDNRVNLMRLSKSRDAHVLAAVQWHVCAGEQGEAFCYRH